MDSPNQKKEVKRIRLKDTMGFGTWNEDYEENLVIEPNKISYEYKPRIESDYHQHTKWSFQTNNPEYKAMFDQLVTHLPALLTTPDEDWDCSVMDLSPTELFVTYSDNSREKRTEYFEWKETAEFFSILSEMIPVKGHSKYDRVFLKRIGQIVN